MKYTAVLAGNVRWCAANSRVHTYFTCCALKISNTKYMWNISQWCRNTIRGETQQFAMHNLDRNKIEQMHGEWASRRSSETQKQRQANRAKERKRARETQLLSHTNIFDVIWCPSAFAQHRLDFSISPYSIEKKSLRLSLWLCSSNWRWSVCLHLYRCSCAQYWTPFTSVRSRNCDYCKLSLFSFGCVCVPAYLLWSFGRSMNMTQITIANSK